MNSPFVAKVFQSTEELCASSTQISLCCLCLIIFLKASAVSVAYFVFSGSTLRYLDKESTATRRFFTPLFYFASLSTTARSMDQISFRSLTIILSLGNLRRRERYLVKDVFVSRFVLFSLKIYSNFAVFLRFQMTQVLLNRGYQVSLHHL